MVNEKKLSDDKGEKRDPPSCLMDANEEFLVDGERALGREPFQYGVKAWSTGRFG